MIVRIEYEHHPVSLVIVCSLIQKIVFLHHSLQLGALPLEDSLGQQGTLLLEHLELALDLVPGLGHLGGDHREIAAVLLQESHQQEDLGLGPVGRGVLLGSGSGSGGEFGDFLGLLEFVLECDFLDEGLECGDG